MMRYFMKVPFLGNIKYEGKDIERKHASDETDFSRKMTPTGESILPDISVVFKIGLDRFKSGKLILRFWSSLRKSEIWLCANKELADLYADKRGICFTVEELKLAKPL
jgi:hypothetical protein